MEPVVRVVILKLRFDNAAVAIAIFGDAKLRSPQKSPQLLSLSSQVQLIPMPRAWSEEGSTEGCCSEESLRLFFNVGSKPKALL